MAGLVLLLLPLLIIAALGVLFTILVLFSVHTAITWLCFQRWPIGTTLFTIIWLAMTYQSGEPFLYAQAFRFVQPVDWDDGPHEAHWPSIDWLVPKPTGHSMRVRASNWKEIDDRTVWTNFERITWMTRIWHRSAWFGHWGDTRERAQHASFEEALEYVQQTVAKASPRRVDWEVFEVRYNTW